MCVTNVFSGERMLQIAKLAGPLDRANKSRRKNLNLETKVYAQTRASWLKVGDLNLICDFTDVES